MGNVIHILLISEDDSLVAAIRDHASKVAQRARVRKVRTVRDASRQLALRSYDVAICDTSCWQVREVNVWESVCRGQGGLPVLLLEQAASGEHGPDGHPGMEERHIARLAIQELTSESFARSIRGLLRGRDEPAEVGRLRSELRYYRRMLTKKRRQLKQLSGTARQFMDGLSHEFRTPLTVIQEYAAVLQQGLAGSITDAQKNMLSVVEDRAHDLDDMVSELLDHSKLRSGTLAAVRKPYCLTALISAVRDRLQKKAALRQVQLDLSVEEDLPLVFCDSEKFARVITSLAGFAIKQSESSGRVTVAAREVPATCEVAVSITSDGPALDQHEVSAIFQPIERCGLHPRRPSQGFGLRLSITNQLVAYNLGRLEVSESRAGCGFTFTVPQAVPCEVTRRYLESLAQARVAASQVFLLAAEVQDSHDPARSDGVDALLSFLERRRDLLFRIQPHRWLLGLPCSPNALDAYFARLEAVRRQANRSRPFCPLPPIALQVIGRWPIGSPTTDVLRRVANVCQSESSQLA